MRAILTLTTAVLFAMFLTGCGGAHTAQYANNDYYPMTVGSTWTYSTKSADGTVDYGETLVQILQFHRIHTHQAFGVATYSEGEGGGPAYWSVHYTASDASGVSRWGRQLLYDPPGNGGTNLVKYAEGRLTLSRPLEVGAQWLYRKSDDPTDLWPREVISTTATVTTPAGTFVNCLQVQESPPAGVVGAPTGTLWYAPGVGLVREETIDNSLPPGTPDAHKIKELMSYTIVEQR